MGGKEKGCLSLPEMSEYCFKTFCCNTEHSNGLAIWRMTIAKLCLRIVMTMTVSYRFRHTVILLSTGDSSDDQDVYKAQMPNMPRMPNKM